MSKAMSDLAVFGGKPVIDFEIPPFDSVGQAEADAVQRVIRHGTLSGFLGNWGELFLGGPEVRRLEAAWAERFDVAHAVSVNSATSGLLAAVGAIGIGPGDEVLMPPMSMSATAIVPLFYGGIPVFVDVERETFCIDPALVEANITEKAKAIIAVNLFGHPAQLHKLREIAEKHDLFLIEDNAQGPLATENSEYAGTIGHIGVFSLNVHKHLHTGEGGICVTGDSELALRLAMIRNHGENCIVESRVADLANMIGLNLRMTEFCAAIGLEQLAKIDRLIERVERPSRTLCEGIGDLAGLYPPFPRDGCRHVYYMWQMRYVPEEVGVSREAFATALAAEGVPSFQGYLPPLYWLPVFQERKAIGASGFPFDLTDRTYPRGLCPVAERMHEVELFGFDPCCLDVDDTTADLVVEAFRKVHRHREQLRDLPSTGASA